MTTIWEKIKNIGNRFLARPIIKITPKEMEAAMKLMDRLKVWGWCEQAAASATAMAMSESGFNTGAEGDKGLANHAHGMWQWRGIRFQDLELYATQTARHWTDFDTQVDYFNKERLSRSSFEKSWHTLTDLTEGCYAGYRYEVYAGPIQSKRQAYAEKFLLEWQRRHH